MGRENAQAKKCAVIGQRGKVNPKSNVAYPDVGERNSRRSFRGPDFESSSQVSRPKQGVAGGSQRPMGKGWEGPSLYKVAQEMMSIRRANWRSRVVGNVTMVTIAHKCRQVAFGDVREC